VTLAGPLSAGNIYRWVDAQGQTHYSDVPRDGAQQIELDQAQTFSAPQPAAPSAAAAQNQPDEMAAYDSVQITSPSQEQTIWNTGGVITVAVSVSPELKQGHRLDIYYDGELVQDKLPRALDVTLTEVYRGQHRLNAQIVNAAGERVLAAAPATFYYQRAVSGDRVQPQPATGAVTSTPRIRQRPTAPPSN